MQYTLWGTFNNLSAVWDYFHQMWRVSNPTVNVKFIFISAELRKQLLFVFMAVIANYNSYSIYFMKWNMWDQDCRRFYTHSYLLSSHYPATMITIWCNYGDRIQWSHSLNRSSNIRINCKCSRFVRLKRLIFIYFRTISCD